MGMMTEFKEFAMRGNVMDLAIAVVIGGAFGKIVSSLVDGIVMPIVSTLTGGIDVSGWKHVIHPAQIGANGKEIAAEVAIRYGDFAQSLINFVIIAFVIFLVVKAINRVHKKPEEAPAATPEDVLLLREIRDSLKK